nr:YcaO-like family protein [Aureimonas phyllosphaerae]
MGSGCFPTDHIRLLEADLVGTDRLMGVYGDRVRRPCETLAKLRPLFPDLGITRLGLLTGLDVIGIPVAFATRPNSFTLSVFQGKGLDVDASMVSAAMEAFETRIAELPPAGLRVGSVRGMRAQGRRTIRLDRTARCVPWAFGEDAAIPWCSGLDLMGGVEIAVPWWLVGVDHRDPRPPGFEQSSDGLSSGNCHAEAVLHGLCELIERDAWTLMRLWPASRLAQARIDPAQFRDPVMQTLVARIERAGVELILLDITSDIGVPSYSAVIVPQLTKGGPEHSLSEVCGGSGCHPIASRAAIRAVVEAAQSRLTAIAGSRDDFSAALYESGSLNGDTVVANLRHAGMSSEPRPSGDQDASLQDQIASVLNRLSAAGIEEAIAVPMGDPCLGLSVVRMVVPGLEVDIGGENVQLGLRAARMMRAAA